MKYIPTDPVHQQIVLGTRFAALAAAKRAKETGTLLVVWRNNHIAKITPEEFLRQQSEAPQNPA